MDESRGHSQYELLVALDSTRLSPTARQRLHELEDRFPDWPPQPPHPAVMSGAVQSPIDGDESEHMSDDDWIAALQLHTGDEPRWDGERFVGGARQLASMLGEQAKDDPERFSRIALRFGEDIPEAAMNAVIRNVESHVGVDVLTDLCEHANRVYGPKVGRSVCSAIGRADAVNPRLVALLTAYASDPDPEREEARTEAFTGDYFYGGDFLTAGLNSTRGQAALSAASLLFRSADHVDALVPTVDALTQDDTVAVRVCAAEAVTALLNHDSPTGAGFGRAHVQRRHRSPRCANQREAPHPCRAAQPRSLLPHTGRSHRRTRRHRGPGRAGLGGSTLARTTTRRNRHQRMCPADSSPPRCRRGIRVQRCGQS